MVRGGAELARVCVCVRVCVCPRTKEQDMMTFFPSHTRRLLLLRRWFPPRLLAQLRLTFSSTGCVLETFGMKLNSPDRYVVVLFKAAAAFSSSFERRVQ
jgi:hypothetical protein